MKWKEYLRINDGTAITLDDRSQEKSYNTGNYIYIYTVYVRHYSSMN